MDKKKREEIFGTWQKRRSLENRKEELEEPVEDEELKWFQAKEEKLERNKGKGEMLGLVKTEG